jgi:hypothetical protein
MGWRKHLKPKTTSNPLAIANDTSTHSDPGLPRGGSARRGWTVLLSTTRSPVRRRFIGLARAIGRVAAIGVAFADGSVFVVDHVL